MLRNRKRILYVNKKSMLYDEPESYHLPGRTSKWWSCSLQKLPAFPLEHDKHIKELEKLKHHTFSSLLKGKQAINHLLGKQNFQLKIKIETESPHLLTTLSRGQTIQYGNPSTPKFENCRNEMPLDSRWYLRTLWLASWEGTQNATVNKFLVQKENV